MRPTARAFVGCLLLAGCGPALPAEGPRAPSPASSTPPEPGPPPEAGRTLPALDPAAAGVAVGIHGAVSSAEAHASAVALEVLRQGGNAVDAAVALGFALAVTHPTAGNLGGGGFMLVRMARGSESAIDYRETAPLAATRDMYLDAAGSPTRDSVIGARAAGIPGTVAGLGVAHARFGTRPWKALLAPAIALARDGHAIDERHAEQLKHATGAMREAGFADSARYYEREDGQPLLAGDVWRQPELARTLERIAEGGPRAFYEGSLARELVAGVRALGGIWSEADLAHYEAIERAPIAFEYRGHRVLGMPPPSAGGIVLAQILIGSEALQAHAHPWRSAEASHFFVEATRRAYADRNTLLADPAFVPVPTERLVSRAYIVERVRNVDPAHATPSASIAAGVAPSQESTDTTHYSVLDAWGNAVANTYTLNIGFGARAVVPGTGVLLNDEMDDFATKPGAANLYGLVQGEANAIAPGKRMLSSMAPTIVTRGDDVRLVCGTPGGSTITTIVAQIVRALVDYGRPLDEAVRAPRIHHQWLPDRVVVEAGTEPAIVEGLRARGHEVEESSRGTSGHATCVEVDPATRGYRAVADAERRGGSALAY